MFRLIRPAGHPRYIDEGKVLCPLRGHDVEFDLCAGCEQLQQLDLTADPPFVRCHSAAWTRRQMLLALSA